MRTLRQLLHNASGWLTLGLLWMREVVGWVLVLLGLWVFAQCVAVLFATPPGFLQAGPLAFIGMIVFRGGIHLLKVSTAAQVCLRAQRQLEQGASGGALPPLLSTPFEVGRREPAAKRPLSR